MEGAQPGTGKGENENENEKGKRHFSCMKAGEKAVSIRCTIADNVQVKALDRFAAMQVFVEVARRGSFSASAEALAMSRAMVTRHVAALEQWLGVRLLQRTTRRVSLTEAGEQALRRCLPVLELVEDVRNEVVPADGILRGVLRLTCSTSFGAAQLAPTLADFLAQHPQLRIELLLEDRTTDLIDARIDLAIRITLEPDPGLVARRLADCASVLVASPAYLKAAGTPRRPADLAAHRCLGHLHHGRASWQLTRAGRTETVRIALALGANEAVSLQAAALAGAGIAMLPLYLCAQALAAGTLRPVLPQWSLPPLAVQALYPSRRHIPHAVRVLLDFLVARYARAAW